MRAGLERAWRSGSGIPRARLRMLEISYLAAAEIQHGRRGWWCLSCGGRWQQVFTDERVPGTSLVVCAFCGTVAQ